MPLGTQMIANGDLLTITWQNGKDAAKNNVTPQTQVSHKIPCECWFLTHIFCCCVVCIMHRHDNDNDNDDVFSKVELTIWESDIALDDFIDNITPVGSGVANVGAVQFQFPYNWKVYETKGGDLFGSSYFVKIASKSNVNCIGKSAKFTLVGTASKISISPPLAPAYETGSQLQFMLELQSLPDRLIKCELIEVIFFLNNR
jgi:hypothetical protein